MRRRWLSLLPCLQVCLCALAVATLVNAVTQTFALRVNEATTRISLVEGQGKVSLAVENDTGRNAPARVTLELLDPHDKVVAGTRRRETLKPGANVVAAFLQVSNLTRPGADVSPLLWYRLRYEIAPAVASPDTPAATPVTGIISLSEITPDLFELRVAAASKANAGQLYRVRVRATHPLSLRPVRGVEIAAEVVFDEDDEDESDDDEESRTLKLTGTTDKDGYATLDFKFPERIKTDEGEIKVTGRRGDVVQTASDDISLNQTTRILLTSDKPLYQPGQTLHLRALLLNHATRRALADAAATLKIEDPEGTTVFTAPLKTSRFGVASCDWPIPDNTRLGDYNVRVQSDESDSDDESTTYLRVKISRYELPNFSVSATPDRGYYLPGESAQIEVRGDYLFGQPLKRGRVRVVRETERAWNYREQKYDIEEGDKYEGELGADGSFRVRVNFSQEFAKLASNTWQRFDDLNYAAYVTDPTTNRTEQRRFRVRLTREPIHIYVTQGNYRQAEGLPLAFYVSTSYADGTPASCELKLTRTSTDKEGVRVPALVKTNAYGVAKVVGSEITEDDDSYVYINLEARDREGRTGKHVESFWRVTQPVVRVETDKTIYRAGEGITARVSSNRKDLKILLDVVSNNRVVATQSARLRGGSAVVEVPYRPEFQNRITLAAYSTEFPEDEYDDYGRGSRAVVYPRNRELKFDVRMSQASYQPGEEASAGVRVRNASGRSVESALGVVVFDKAVEERARTEQEFASSYGFSNYFYQFWYGLESIGGLGLRDIEQLDAGRALPAGVDAVADLLLQREYEYYRPNYFSSSHYNTNQTQVFSALATAGLRATRDALKARYDERVEHPSDAATLRRLLADAGVALEELRDPWGTPYRLDFSVARAEDVLEFRSAGADKRHGTDDDWTAARFNWQYFRPTGEAINRAVIAYHRRTGGFVRDAATLRGELARDGFDLDALRDRWGNPYALVFEINGTNYSINILSGGPDGRLTSILNSNNTGDDFAVWTTWTDYFAETRARVDAAVAAYLTATGRFPRDEAALREVLRRVGLGAADLKDPWGSDYYATFRTESRYADRVQVQTGGQLPSGKTNATPVTRQLEFITLRSAGVDGKAGTADDFNVAEFSRIVSDQSAQDAKPQIAPVAVTFSGDTGAIGGTILDSSGAVIVNATVTATSQYQTDRVFTTTTDEDGKYLLRNLPAGLYTVRVDAAAFKQAVAMDVPVQSATLATLNLSLEVGTVSETVTVTAAGSVVDSTDNKIQTNITRQSLKLLGGNSPTPQPPISTPRLRKDFPETLYWQPAVETDARGRAELRFKLADNITTWKMSIIGSTETGELGTVEREIRSFLPFFVEHDPPRILTEGDEISLPVVLRNYLERAQSVALDIKPEDWFTLLSPAHKQSNVPAGDAARETFDFRAVASVKEGLQRITAIGTEASDQIEKPVHVHPDGEEVAATATQILRGSSLLEVNVPTDALPRTARAELKIYPNLMAHAIESVEAIMSRPYGCGEQTISSTYPSLLVLRHYRRTGGTAGGTMDGANAPPITAKAARYVRQGYERLLSYRSDSGGFSYWGRGEPDLALTAYALRFLTDARDFIAVDESVIAGTREWLIRQQNADGSWTAYSWDKSASVDRRNAMLTAYVARILAMQQANAARQSVDQTKLSNTTPPTPLRRALDYLAPRAAEWDEPYLVASYALAAIDGGESPDKIARTLGRLRALAHEEADGSYWNLETNTPFYGWGNAGRIETTALAVQALTKAGGDGGDAKGASGDANSNGGDAKTEKRSSGELLDRGLLFLLKNKDRYGVWLSTQATVNVLDALNALSTAGASGATTDASGAMANVSGATTGTASAMRGDKVVAATASQSETGAAQKVEVFVNGQSAGTLTLPATHEPANPISLDLSRLVAAGANRVEIRRVAGAGLLAATAQLVTTYYRPWAAANADGTHARPQDSRALRLSVGFDRTAATTGDTVTCRVAAERVGHRGYGMLLAEVGLPPGADVDRASLELAMKESGWEFSHYDVLPDRLVVYLWPRAGGTQFQFTFRPRYGLAAKSAASVVYDYYNPEARAVLAPTKFNVNDRPKPAPSPEAGRE